MPSNPTETDELPLPESYEAPVLTEYGTLLDLTQSGPVNANENSFPFGRVRSSV